MRDKIFVIAVCVIMSSLFIACSDSSNILTTSQKTNVSGRVIGGFFNAGASNAKVQIESKIVFTDTYGRFVINDVQVPYDVYITDSVNYTGSIYRNLTSSECWLQHFSNQNINNLPQASVSVTLSSGIGNSSGWKAFFTDGKNTNSIGDNGNCNIYLPENNTVTGKVCVILYTANLNGYIISYDKFGYVDNVSVSPGTNANLVFTDSMLSYNPSESRVTGTISGIPPHSSTEFSHYLISMSPRKSNYYLTQSSIFLLQGNTFDFYVPVNLPVSFYPMLNVYLSDSSSIGLFYSGVSYLLPKNGATGLNITFPQPPQLLSPSGLSFVDSNTSFTYSFSGTDRIFKITFSDSALKTFNIYTNADNVNMQNLWKLGLGKFNPNSTISYKVQVFGGYNSVDDYANPNYQNVSNYSPKVMLNAFYIKP